MKRENEIIASECIYDSISKEPYLGFVVIKDGCIQSVGKGKVPDSYYKSDFKITDYGNVTICAGFGDTHTFFTGFIIDNLGVNLSDVITVDELKKILVNEQKLQKEVIFGNHLSMSLVENHETTELLDEIGKEQPIVLFALGHGTCALNQKAREEFGFDPDHCHSEALYKIMKIYLNDREFVNEQLVSYMSMLNSRGVTSVKEMGFDDFYGFTDVLKEFDEANKLTLRISFMSQPVGDRVNIEYGKKMRELFQSEYLRFSGFNQMTDGLILKKEGHLMEPYENFDSVCEKVIDYKAIEEDVLKADKEGFRFTLHSEGDGAFHKILDIYEKCEKENGVLKNRHGITDLELTMPDDEKRMARLGVFGEIYAQVYSIDTYEGYVDGYKNVIGNRQKRYLNYRSLVDNGVRLCGATDLPMVITSIPESIYYGCANYGMDKDKQINPENAITISEMLDAWTINSQFAMEREDVLGSLEAGKRADIVIFDGNLFQTQMDQVLSINVQRTLVNGREVYKI